MGDRDDAKGAVRVSTTEEGAADAVKVTDAVDDTDAVDVMGSATAATAAGGRPSGTAGGGASGTAGGGDVPEAADTDRDAMAAEDVAEGSARRRRWPRRRIAATAVLALVVVLAGVLLYAAQQLKDPAASGNRALTDTAATDQVTGDVSNALSRIFAYTPDDTQSTAQAARDLLAGAAATQYQQLFARIRQQVADEKLTLTTRVVRAGVVSLTASRARLLVFLDQTAQRAGGTATSAAAQLSVTAEYSGGRWRITDLKAR